MYFVLILLMKFALTIFATESEGIFVKKKKKKMSEISEWI